MAQKVDFFQIYYDEPQKAEMFPFATPYFNERLSIFFENTPIRELVLASEAEKIAVCSWKLRKKLRFFIGKPRELTLDLLESDYDVMSFTKNTKYHDMLAAAEAHHPGFMNVMGRIFAEVGLELPKRKLTAPIYQNHFVARREIYHDYVKTYLFPCMEVMTNHPEIKEMVLSDSNYSNLNKKGVSADYLKEKIGVAWYPLAPFLLERLFSIYCQNKRINVSYL